jgi:hypothetical protein
MGLKTTNYVSKSTGIVLPEAYAVLTNLIVETDNRARAIFAVQASRENAQSYQALDKVEVRFTWDRKTNPAEMAYEAAKAQVELETVYNENGTVKERKVKEYGTLYGWENDIV